MSSSTNDCIKFMLDIKDKNIFFKDQYYKLIQGKKCKIFEAVLIQPACPFCGSIDLLHNGRYKSDIRYLTANASFPVIIRLFKQRVLCRDCNRRSMAQTNLVKKYCSISNASKLKVLSALTEHLASDEFKGVDRQLHFICLDGEKYEVIQILRTRYKKTLLKYFGRFSPEARENVKTVTMDLNFYYQGIVRACFPNAKIVIDRFHMVQMFARSFNSLRVKVMKQFKKNTRSYQLLKAPWKLYLKKYDDLKKTHPRYNWHYKDSLTQEQVVNEGISTDPILSASYELMQDFISALKNHDEQALKTLIFSKETVGEVMHKTLMTFRKNFKWSCSHSFQWLFRGL